MEYRDERARRDNLLGRLYDTLLRAQSLAELAGHEQMGRQLREMRRRVQATLLLTAPIHNEDDRERDS